MFEKNYYIKSLPASLFQREEHLWTFFGIAAIVGLGWYMQMQAIISPDLVWCYLAAERLFDGGDYVKNFLETNPPLILYFNYPVILISRLTSLDPIFLLRVYLFLIGFLSLGISIYFINKLFDENDRAAIFFKAMLSVAIFILPVNDFGQREHITFILTLPYFLLVAMRLQQYPIKKNYAYAIGILSAIGFGLKPYFLVAPFFVELFAWNRTKKFSTVFRPETVSILICLLVYFFIVVVYFPAYVHILLPFFSRVYYQGLGKPFLSNLISHNSLFVALIILFYFTQIKHSRHKILNTVLLLATMGFYISYFLGRNDYYYHIIPAFSYGFCLLALLYADFLQQKIHLNRDVIFLLLFGISIILFWVDTNHSSWVYLSLQPAVFIAFFALLFFVSLLLSTNQRNFLKLILITASICTLGYYFSYITKHTEWYKHNFILTLSFLILLFCLFNLNPHKISLTIKTLLGAFIFTYPFTFILGTFNSAQIINQKVQQGALVQFISQHAKSQPVSFLTTTSVSEFPVINFAEAKLGSRFEFFWMLPGLLKQERQIKTHSQLNRYLQDKLFFTTMIAEDLKTYQPLYVFVDISRFKPHLGSIDFNYLTYLQTNALFHKEWNHYRYLTTLENDIRMSPSWTYKFDVYVRDTTKVNAKNV